MTIAIHELAPGDAVRVLRYSDGRVIEGRIARVDPRSAYAELDDEHGTRVRKFDTLVSHRRRAA